MTFVDDALRVLGNLGPNEQNLTILDSCRDRLIPFVGAGLSMHFGYPSWNTLLDDMAEQVGLGLEVRTHITKLEFEEAAELVVTKASLNYLDDTLKLVFDHNKIPKPIAQGAVQYLPLIAKGPVLTTNFDRVVEAAFIDANKPFADIFHGARIREASRAIQFEEPFLLKLHGDYRDSEHRILTLTQYTSEYGSSDPAKADLDLPLPTVLGQALASRPLLFLGCSLKSDRTLTVIARIARRYSGTVHFALLSDSELSPARINQLYSWNIRPLFFLSNDYSKIEHFLACLALSCEVSRSAPKASVSRVSTQPANRAASPRNISNPSSKLAPRSIKRSHRHAIGAASRDTVHINGYKLFYFRMMRKLSFSDLSRISGVARHVIRTIEMVDNGPHVKGIHRFQQCSRIVLTKLEKALECWGQLQGGKGDDSLSMYIQFYFTYKGSDAAAAPASNQMKIKFQTRVVAFDFDGTLTKKTDNRTTWEKLWVILGYSIDDSADLHRRFNRGDFTHEKWCELTKDKFLAAKLREEQLLEIARETRLIEGTKETLESLRKSGIRLYILSGSIKQVIKAALGDLYGLFDEVKANEIRFDSSGLIDHIIGTRYDFQGKAEFLSNVIADQQLSPLDVLYVGNSSNDVWASQSGARTLCVNPHMTNPDIEEHWTYAIKEMTDLRQIMKFIQI
jgi:HAD superfamily phosphoserine phosphatase-like hydrolase